MKSWKVIGIAFFSLLFIFSIVESIGGSEPKLERGWLLRGESTRFYFEIISDTDTKQTCTYSVSNLNPLAVKFDEGSVTINPHSTKKVFGTISVPSSASINTYKGEIRVSCSPYIKMSVSGSAVKQTFYLPLTVHVVSTLPKGVTTVAAPARKPSGISSLSVLGGILIIIAIVGIFYLAKRRREASPAV